MTAAASERATGLFQERPRAAVVRDLTLRSRSRLEALPAPALEAVLEDALWNERNRMRRARGEDDERDHLEDLAQALVHGDRDAQVTAGLRLVADWADEIHGRFDPRVYRLATRLLPRGLSTLLSPRGGRRSPGVVVEGDLDGLRSLSREATLVLCPTHVSNLDSPLIGLALYLAGLPPFVYGAGLNLFDNKLIGWWMHRLGAYTVDRRKQARLYKDVLKDYSVRALTTRHHSLFFPGGTRSRSGQVEQQLKKGLMGTGIVAWQEMLAAGRPDPNVYFVPLTLSFSLVLEASTLIDDHLSEAGKQRYIITDDESTQPRRLAAFARRVLDLDAAVIAHFGAPLDVLGDPVSADPEERAVQSLDRRAYVCDADGAVRWDAQRDRVYTDRLASELGAVYPRYAHVLPTHVAAYAAWQCLAEDAGSDDPFRLVRLPRARRRLSAERTLRQTRAVIARIRAGATAGRWQADLPDADEALRIALDHFGRYHRSHALMRSGDDLLIEDPRLCFYYHNRLEFMDRGEK